MEAVVLANRESRMLLAVAGLKDAFELRRWGTDWLDERNEPVQFGFLLAADEEACEAPRLTRAAGGYAS
ncbi:MAG TPA: hypothetical protein VGE89_00790 [Bryobacteraceae bacterium]